MANEEFHILVIEEGNTWEGLSNCSYEQNGQQGPNGVTTINNIITTFVGPTLFLRARSALLRL